MICFIRHYLLAVQYFTRIPITGKLAQWVGYSPQALQSSASHFPGIGLLVGSISCAVMLLSFQYLPQSPFTPLLAAFLSTFASILLTGAFHEDGLADSADGFGGSCERARTLEIMKDSRIGTYGSLALLLVVGSKISMLALLLSLNPPLTFATLILGHVLSRWISLLVMRILPPVIETENSKSKPLVEGIRGYHLLIGTIWGIGTFLIISPFFPLKTGLFGLGFALVIGIFLGRKYLQRLQGYTGDCLGATQQLTEIAFYLGTLFFIGK